jgi:Flp pilus assembly protein TadG
MMLLKTNISAIRAGDRRGAAVVECALVLPLLIIIVMGAIGAGQFVNVAQIVTDASREGARRASRNMMTTEAEVESAVQDYFAEAFPGVPASDLNAALTVDVTDSLGAAIVDGDLTTIASGSSLSVQVTFQYDTVQWIAGSPIFSGQSIQTETTMRRE